MSREDRYFMNGVTIDSLIKTETADGIGMIPPAPKGKNIWGSVTVSDRGQIVIPKEARDMFSLQPGDTLVLMADKKKGLALQTVDKLNPLMKTVFNSLPSGEEEAEDE